jgi:hypothetical protein
MNMASVLNSTVPQEANSTQHVSKLLKERYAEVPFDLIDSTLPPPSHLAEPECPLLYNLSPNLSSPCEAGICLPILADGEAGVILDT